MKENKKLVSEIIKDIQHDMSDEEILTLLAGSKISENTEKETKKLYSFGQRAADKIFLHVDYGEQFFTRFHRNAANFLMILSAMTRSARWVGCTPSGE